jgi:hypothetical protein
MKGYAQIAESGAVHTNILLDDFAGHTLKMPRTAEHSSKNCGVQVGPRSVGNDGLVVI